MVQKLVIFSKVFDLKFFLFDLELELLLFFVYYPSKICPSQTDSFDGRNKLSLSAFCSLSSHGLSNFSKFSNFFLFSLWVQIVC